jgi:anti-sigma factor ChrR (cupin superfamily)
MLVNADLSERAVVRPGDAEWVPSPAGGVLRRMLDRVGDEVARATSIVRYLPHSRFPEHTHGGGEEFLILEGVFFDESGAYPAGHYVRNPIGSHHAPYTEEGCTIFVKLRQFDAADIAHVVIDTSSATWHEDKARGMLVLPLHAFGEERVALERWPAGARIAMHEHVGGEEMLVLEGELRDEEGRYPAGTWMRSPHRSRHAPSTEEGCVVYVKSGHLPRE